MWGEWEESFWLLGLRRQAALGRSSWWSVERYKGNACGPTDLEVCLAMLKSVEQRRSR